MSGLLRHKRDSAVVNVCCVFHIQKISDPFTLWDKQTVMALPSGHITVVSVNPVGRSDVVFEQDGTSTHLAHIV